jgi:hypothetical protein
MDLDQFKIYVITIDGVARTRMTDRLRRKFIENQKVAVRSPSTFIRA